MVKWLSHRLKFPNISVFCPHMGWAAWGYRPQKGRGHVWDTALPSCKMSHQSATPPPRKIYFSICVPKIIRNQDTMQFDKVIAKIERCNFFASQCSARYQHLCTYCQARYQHLQIATSVMPLASRLQSAGFQYANSALQCTVRLQKLAPVSVVFFLAQDSCIMYIWHKQDLSILSSSFYQFNLYNFLNIKAIEAYQ